MVANRHAGRRPKRRLKRWVKITLWLIALLGIAAALWWPVSTLREYWAKTPSDTSKKEHVHADNIPDAQPDSVIERRISEFILKPTRLDTNNIAISVYDLTANTPVLQWHDTWIMPPASCLKLLTAITAIKTMGMDHQYEESMKILGKVQGDSLVGDAILEADDDPICESLDPLITSLKERGIHRITGRLILNLTRKDTLRAHPTARTWDIPYNKTPILLKGGPRLKRDLNYALRLSGIKVPEIVVNDAKVPYPAAKTIKTLRTPLKDVIEPMLIHSSNIKADALNHHLNHYYDRFYGYTGEHELPWQFFVREQLKYENTEGFVVNDGSGLSPENRLCADFLMALLKYAWHDEPIRKYFLKRALATPGEPGRTGSLTNRMSRPQFRGRIYCKTGTLVTIGSSSLSGYAKAQNGHWYAFVVINQDSPVAESRLYQDKLCAEFVK